MPISESTKNTFYGIAGSFIIAILGFIVNFNMSQKATETAKQALETAKESAETAKQAAITEKLKLAYEILKTDPDHKDTLRSVAINILEQHAGKEFSEQTRKNLLEKSFDCSKSGMSLDFSDPCNSGHIPGL